MPKFYDAIHGEEPPLGLPLINTNTALYSVGVVAGIQNLQSP